MTNFNQIIASGYAFRLLQTQALECAKVNHNADGSYTVKDEWKEALSKDLEMHAGELGSIRQLLNIVCTHFPANPTPLVRVNEQTMVRPTMNEPVTV